MKSVPQSDVPQSPFLWSAAIFATLPACRIFRVPPWLHLGGLGPLGGWDFNASAAAPLMCDRFRRCTQRRDDGDSPTRN
jgi:hypothetical protein